MTVRLLVVVTHNLLRNLSILFFDKKKVTSQPNDCAKCLPEFVFFRIAVQFVFTLQLALAQFELEFALWQIASLLCHVSEISSSSCFNRRLCANRERTTL